MRENKYDVAHVFYYDSQDKNGRYVILCWIEDPYKSQITQIINSFRLLLNSSRYEYRRE